MDAEIEPRDDTGDVLDASVRYAKSWRAEGGEVFGPALMLDLVSLARAALTEVESLRAEINNLKGGSAKVVPMRAGSSASCAGGYCPASCSHLMWECRACTSEGGWGAPRVDLISIAAAHVCPPDFGTPSGTP